MRLGRSVTTKLVAMGLIITPLVAPRSAAAQSAGTEVALAEVLYQKGRELMAAGNYAEACPKFAESYRLDAATGTLLNLAACHEGEHKVATAWLEFTEALASAKRDQREDRVKFAQDHLTAIEPKLSRLTVAVAPTAEIPDLKVQLDGIVLVAAARGLPAPVDSGEHVVEAQAPGRKPWSQRIRINEQAQTLTVTVPLLEAEAPSPPPVVAPPAPSAAPPAAETLARPIPTSVYVAGAATIVLALGSGVTGGMYMSDRSGANAKAWGVANLALLAGTIVGGGATAYLYWTRPSRSASAITVAPWISSSGGGVSVGGSL